MNDAATESGFLKRHLRLLVASGFLALGLVWIMKRGALPLLPPQGTLAHTDWWLVALSALALFLSIILRFARYTFLISSVAHVPMRRILTISSIALGLVTFLPFRLGEFARPAMLREKGRLSGWAVTGTVGAERIIDGVLFGLMLLAGLALAEPREPLPDHIGSLPVPAKLVPQAALFATVAFVGAFVVMAIFYWWRTTARRITEWSLGLVSKRLAGVLADAVERLSDGLRFLTDPRKTLPFLGVSVVASLLHIWSMQLLAGAVGLGQVDFAQATVLTGVLGLAFALPNAPGFFGTIQLALYAGLAVYVTPSQVVTEGAALVFLFYVSYLSQVVLITVGGLLFESRGATDAPMASPSK